MGVDSEGSEGIGVVGEVGRIVWVRRRNGSWWPGRILGQHELSASHLMYPRSGTPVKLLGREDASVDWYNLEKSKRVKAFRCAEFDACIERAEASQGVPIKKREKYARREDAILHALELEKKMLEGRRQGPGSSFSDIHPGPLRKEQCTGFRTENDVSISDNSSHRKLLNYMNMDLASTETTKGKPFSEKWKGDMHDDRFETALRKRGLQAFGVQNVLSKRKLASSGSSESSKSLFFMDNPLHPHPAPMHDIDHSFLENSPDIEFSEEAINKRQNNCGTVLQVLPKTTHPYGYASDLLRTCQSYSKYRGLLKKENKSFGVIEPYVSDVLERLHSASDTEDDETLIPSTSQSFLSELVGCGKSGEYDNWGCTTEGSLQSLNKNATVLSDRRMHGLVETGVSRWNLKGKRNIRKASNRAVKPTNVNIDNLVSYDDKKCIYNISRGGTGYVGSDSQTDYSVDSDLIDKDIDSDFSPTGEGTYPLVFQENSLDSAYNMDDSDRDSCEMSRSCWDTEKQFHAPQRRQWDRLPRQFGYFYASKYRDRLDSGLVDVDLKVQASYQGNRAPLVSLTSKLDGKAIIGHSIQVEAASDGFIDTLLQDIDYGENPSFSDGNGMAPVRRTGRRSALFHIPHPHAPSDLEDCEVGVHNFSDLESRVPIKSQLAINTGEWSRHTKKGSHSHRPAKKLQKKSSKQSSTWDVKPRSLSSLAKWRQSGTAHNKVGKLSSKASTLHTLIMPGDVVPLVSCIPAKVVFSRILQSVGRSPFHAAAHGYPVTATG